MTTNLRPVVLTGRPAWAPLPEVSDLVVLHGHDVPLVACYRSDGHWAVSAFIAGEPTLRSIWVTLPLSDVEAKELTATEFPSVDAVFDAVYALATHRWAIYVAAVSGEVAMHDDVRLAEHPFAGLSEFTDNVLHIWSAGRQQEPASNELLNDVDELVGSF